MVFIFLDYICGKPLSNSAVALNLLTMRSSIKIDFQETIAGLEPFISVELSKSSDDARDKLLHTFFKRLGTKSSYLKVEFLPDPEEKFVAPHFHRISITPIASQQLHAVATEMAQVSEGIINSTGAVNGSPLEHFMNTGEQVFQQSQ